MKRPGLSITGGVARVLAAAHFGCAVFAATGGEPAMRVVKSPADGAGLLRNGNFEQVTEGKPVGWAAAPNGFSLVNEQGKDSSGALRCENQTASQWSGANQTLALNRTRPSPLVVRGWGKAEDVSGSADSGFGLYVDIVYDDGTPLWGQTANFRTGTHDWQMRELVILPQRPVRTLTLHCIFRGHTGRAWFDDITIHEISDGGAHPLFQGLPVTVAGVAAAQGTLTSKVTTVDGLSLESGGNSVVSLVVSGRELAVGAPSGFLARDVAANSDIFSFKGGECAELGLNVESKCRAERDHLVIEGKVIDTTGRDRAITLFYSLPVDATGWQWEDDIRRSRKVEGTDEYTQVVTVGSGATGTMSLYPLAAIHDRETGLAMGVDMGKAAQYRVAYNAGTRQFFIAYDFGLVPETRAFPSSAEFRFVVFRFDPGWGFRAAFQKYMEVFPGHFLVRSKEQGIWMPFTDVSRVREWRDFGFKYHEGNNNVPWDDEHGVLSFRYTEPMTWWMRMRKNVPRTFEAAIEAREQLANGPDAHQKELARVCRVAAMFDETGQPALLFKNEPWCDGAVWSWNPNPVLPAGGGAETGGLNGATLHWNESLKEGLYGPKAKGRLDGEYIDSIEGYVTADLNFRRDHFAHTSVPLTFSSDTRLPALHKGLAVFEFTRWLGEEVHRMDKLLFANGVPYRFSFLCPWLDVLGTETDWLVGGKFRPASDAQMSLWRTLSGRKPYVLLMNTDYNVLTPDLVERYFQRSLFYGMFPSMFSHNASENPYWLNPKWYERDRPLFKKYMPIIKRVAEAGWEPVTWGKTDNQRIFVERFGPGASGRMYFTLMNESQSGQRGRFTIDRAGLQLREKRELSARELVSGNALVKMGEGAVEIRLEPWQVQVLEIELGE